MKILVIGESCEDVFNYCRVDRLAPDVPAPVCNSLYTEKNKGMAGNVFNNIKSFNIDCDLITNKNKSIKTRYIDESCNYTLLRLDEHDESEPFDFDFFIKKDLKQYNAIIISDYNKGFLTPEDIFKISNSHPLTFLDTKKYLSDWCENISFIKLNNSEYQKNLNFLSTAPFVLEKVIKTRGRHGCSFNGKNYPTEDVLIKDVSGAGDTFISCLAIEYCKSNDIVLAINFAQKCTTKVVQKQGVSTPE